MSAKCGILKIAFYARKEVDRYERTGRLRLVLCTLLCFVLCSCQTVLQANEKAQVEELLRAPKLSGDYGALQVALNDWLGESAQLKIIQGAAAFPLCAAGLGR